jgi:GNAT superfamily N-acetyltransferase
MILRKFQLQDSRNLAEYLSHLCPETKKRFGPHSFDEQTIADLYESSSDLLGYLAIDPDTTWIEAYAIVKMGTLEHDRSRLESYGLILDNRADCTLAPSVSDAWQGKGLGREMLQFILSDLQQAGIKRIFLWGGVQADNVQAIRFYQKNGFNILGKFVHQGENLDLVLVTGNQ